MSSFKSGELIPEREPVSRYYIMEEAGEFGNIGSNGKETL
jgi:hypothetical protein